MKFHALLTEKGGFTFGSDYAKARFIDYAKKHPGDPIEIVAGVESKKARGYLEAAIIPSYCKHQYGLDPRTSHPDAMRYLFKTDFAYDIVRDREGIARRVPRSSQGQAVALANLYTEWAVQNGFPVPNAALWKRWKNEFKSDGRYATYWDWLEALGLEEDAGPSQVPEEKKGKMPEYPEGDGRTALD